jgi:hypothetical protein
MKFKLTIKEVEKIVNDIALNGAANKAVFVKASPPNENTRCMEIIVGTPIYMEDLLEIAKYFDDANIMFDTTYDRELAMYIVPGEQFFVE